MRLTYLRETRTIGFTNRRRGYPLRVRTEARRRAILDAARSVFEEQGFDRATMAQISERLGGSKTTLYSPFPTKEELVVACVQEDIATDTDVMMDAVRSTPDLHK